MTSILNSNSIRNYIESESEGSQKKIAKLRKKASKYVWEICSDMSYPFIYLYDRALTWFWNSRYENLEVLNFEEIRKLSERNAFKLLNGIRVFDVYEGDKIGANEKAYAVSFFLQDQEKTLTDKVIDKTMQRLMTVFEKDLGATIRK